MSDIERVQATMNGGQKRRHPSHKWNTYHSMLDGFLTTCDSCLVEDEKLGFDQPCEPFDPLIGEAVQMARERIGSIFMQRGAYKDTYEWRLLHWTCRFYMELLADRNKALPPPDKDQG